MEESNNKLDKSTLILTKLCNTHIIVSRNIIRMMYNGFKFFTAFRHIFYHIRPFHGTADRQWQNHILNGTTETHRCFTSVFGMYINLSQGK